MPWNLGHLPHDAWQVPNNEQNALLSDEAKRFMAILAREFPDMCAHSFISLPASAMRQIRARPAACDLPESLWTYQIERRCDQLMLLILQIGPCCKCSRCTPAFLAQLFRVRQQRVMAILALKKLEFEAEEQYKADMAAEQAAALEQAAERQRQQQAQQQGAERSAAEAGAAQAAGASADAGADAGTVAATPAADGAAADGPSANAGSVAGGSEAAADSTAAAAGAAPAPAEAAAGGGGHAAGSGDGGGDLAGDAGADSEQPKRGRGANLSDFQTEEELDEFTKDMHELDVLLEVSICGLAGVLHGRVLGAAAPRQELDAYIKNCTSISCWPEGAYAPLQISSLVIKISLSRCVH